MSTFENVKMVASRFGHIWDDVTDLIIRPKRAEYNVKDLGPSIFRISDYNAQNLFQRVDMDLENMRGMTIKCSWYQPYSAKTKEEEKDPMPCMVYLHGNCGSRMDGLELLWVLRHGMTLFTYDACGSGLSDGDYVSLGYYERQDLAAVVEFLQATKTVSAIGLWGRSMGGVTSIMYSSRDPSIACVVTDSPFSSLGKLTEDLVGQHASWVPNGAVNMAVRKVRKNVLKKAGFDFRDLTTTNFAERCLCPSFIFHGIDDDFVPPSHSSRVADHYGGSCLYRQVQGGHNSERGVEVQKLAIPFLKLYLIDKAYLVKERVEEATLVIAQEEVTSTPGSLDSEELDALLEAELKTSDPREGSNTEEVNPPKDQKIVVAQLQSPRVTVERSRMEDQFGEECHTPNEQQPLEEKAGEVSDSNGILTGQLEESELKKDEDNPSKE